MGCEIQRVPEMWYLCMRYPGLPKDFEAEERLPPSSPRNMARPLIYIPTTTMNEEEEPPQKRVKRGTGTVTMDVENRTRDRLMKASVGSFLFADGIRNIDLETCVRNEIRNSVLVLAFLALQGCHFGRSCFAAEDADGFYSYIMNIEASSSTLGGVQKTAKISHLP